MTTQVPPHLLARAEQARLKGQREAPIGVTVIGLTGYAQSGKDSAAAFLVEKGWTRLSFADALRAAVYALNPIVDAYAPSPQATVRYRRVQYIVDTLGYEEAKRTYPEYRELLQRFGTEVGREQFGENFWTDRVKVQIKPGGKYVISDVRFPNEADTVREAGGKVFRINRAGTGAINAHVSDTGIDSLVVDGVIPNLTTLDHFRDLVLAVADEPLD